MPDKDNRQDIKINTLEVNYLSMSDQIKDLKTTVNKGFTSLDDKVDKGLANLKEEFKCMREESDKKYASKRTEKVVDNLTWLVLSSVVLAGLALIVMK